MSSDKIAAAVQQELRSHIVQRAAKQSLSLTDELMGYTFYAANVESQYAPTTQSAEPKRRVAVPEFLTGLVNNYKV